MKNLFLFIAMMGLYAYAYTQPVGTIMVPKFGLIQPVTPPGTLVNTTITNKGTIPATFVFQYPVPGMTHVFNYKDTLVMWIKSQIDTTASIDDQKMQGVNIVGRLVKSALHENRLLITGEWVQNTSDINLVDSVRVRKHDPIGAFGFKDEQCGDMGTDAIELLVATGLFQYWEFHNASFPGHVGIEFWYKNGWVFADFDSGMPGFIFINPANSTGYATAEDLCFNHNLITESQFYRWISFETGDSINLCPWATLAWYQSFFVNPNITPIWITLRYKPYERTGKFTLSAGASLTFSSGYVTPNKYWLSMAFPEVRTLKVVMDSIGLQYQAIINNLDTTGQSAALAALGNSAINAFVTNLPISADSAQSWLVNQRYEFIAADFTPPAIHNDTVVPTIRLSIPSTPYNLILGKDVSSDLWVTNVKAEGTMYLTYIPIDSATFRLWANGAAGEFAPGLPKEQVNTFSWGNIPANIPVIADLAFNPRITNPEKGFVLEKVTGGDSLVVNEVPALVDTTIVSSVSNEEPVKKGNSFDVYPNPSSRGITIATDIQRGGVATVHNISGQIIDHITIENNTTQYLFESAGIYFIHYANTTKRIIVTK